MPNVNQPTFRRRKDGRYVTKWGGKERVLGRARDTAWANYLAELERWRQWRERRDAAMMAPAPVVAVL
jgi:hypothetical protein